MKRVKATTYSGSVGTVVTSAHDMEAIAAAQLKVASAPERLWTAPRAPFPGKVTAVTQCSITVQPYTFNEDGTVVATQEVEFIPILLPQLAESEEHKFNHNFAVGDIVPVFWFGSVRVVLWWAIFGNTYPEPSDGDLCEEEELSAGSGCYGSGS